MFRTFVILCCTVSLLSCGQGKEPPTGQVVARVNGQEITLSELNAELLANNLADKAEDKRARGNVIERIVARKLLVEAAKDQGLHKNSEFILSRQRSEESELAALAQQHLLRQVKPPTKQEAEQYVKAHPERFTGRKQMIFDQIRFVRPANANDTKFLASTKSLDEAAEKLKQNVIRFDRALVVFDTSSVDPKVAAQIDKLAPGEVFTIVNGKMVLVNVITHKRPAAITPDVALQYASRLIQQERAQNAIQSQVSEMRKRATITYQAGYEPKSR